ncbi:MAG: mercuric transporter MerT family protein [bacterium]|nr:mercuric transporter MerT family protein [bacterium]
MKNDDKTFLKIGVLAAFLASLCCLGPLILIALGLGTASSVLSIGYGKPYFLIGAIIFFIFAVVFYFRKKNKAACDCGDGTQKLDKKKVAVQIVIAFCVMIILYFLLTLAVVPYLAPLVYKYLY